MNFRFTIIGVTETRICDRECSFNFVPELPGYCFESVPTPLSAGGVGLFIDQNCKYRVLERVSNSCYQAHNGLNFICLTLRNLYVVLLIDNTIRLMSF